MNQPEPVNRDVDAADGVLSEPCLTQPVTVARSKTRLTRRQQDLILIPAVFVVFMGLWEVLSRAGVLNPVVLPAPSAIWKGFIDLVSASWFPPHLLTTAYETISGYLLGSLAGVIIGVALATFPLLKRLSYPYIVVFQVIPKVVLAPIFLVWFGLGMTSKIVLTATISFFPVVVNTILGLESVDENSVLLMKSLCASKWQTFWKVAFPNALPAIFAGLETAATIAMIGAIVAEFVTAKQGLGLLLTTFSMEMKIASEFGVIVVVALLGLLIYGIVVLIKRKAVFWEGSWKSELL